MAEGKKETIVVGMDGSEPAMGALRWAVRYAQMSDARLYVVTAWTYPDEPTPFGIVPELPLRPDQMDVAEAKLHEAVARVVSPTSPLDVTAEVVRGHAATVLLDASRHADLLVVGNRGRGAVAELLLGSVSERCVRHASCPVVVVRDGSQSSTVS